MQPLPFSAATVNDRVAALFDAATTPVLVQAGSLLLGRGDIAQRPVLVAAADPLQYRGALGEEETRALGELFEEGRRLRQPLVLILDSAGARVDQGLAALGGFRRLLARFLAAEEDGVRAFALLGRWCFGGASLLAGLCERRSYLASTLLATSGPAVIEAMEGKQRFDAADRANVAALLGAQARLAWHDEDEVRADTLPAARESVVRWLTSARAPVDLGAIHEALRRRLAHQRDAAPSLRVNARRAAALLPPGYAPSIRGHLFRALPVPGSGRAVFLGVLGGDPVTAHDCFVLADWLLESMTDHPNSPVILVLDASAHASTVDDERVLLADYLVHLSRTIRHLRSAGNRPVLWIAGAASGASYVAFAAPATRVSALPGARISILPPAAVEQIIGERREEESGEQDAWFATGVADALLDDRLRRYSGEHTE